MTKLAILPSQTEWSPAQVDALHSLGYQGVDNASLDIFLGHCQRTGLDPFVRQIYLTGRTDWRTGAIRYVVQTSIDGLRIIAQRSAEYEGQTRAMWCGPDGAWRDVWLEAHPPAAAYVGVWRSGFREPLVATARWEEYAPAGNAGFMWRKMPALMLAKVAEALALRKAFPLDLAGIYTDDEMDQGGPVTPPPQPPKLTTDELAQVLTEVYDRLAAAESDEDYRTIWRWAATEGVLGLHVLDDDMVETEQTVAQLIAQHREETAAAVKALMEMAASVEEVQTDE